MLSIINLRNELKNMDIDQISNPREVLKDIINKLSEIKIDYNNLTNDEIFQIYKTERFVDFVKIHNTSYAFNHKLIYIDKMFTNKNTDIIIDHKEKIELLLSHGYYFLEKHHPIRILLNQDLTPYIESILKIVIDYYYNKAFIYRLESVLNDDSNVYNFNKQTTIFVRNYIQILQKQIFDDNFNKEINKIINMLNNLV